MATVVLDTPPRSETAALEAARAADLVIVPCRPQIVDLETVPTTIQVLALARDPLAVAVLVAVPPRGQRADQARRAIHPTMPIVSRSPKPPHDSSDRALVVELIRLIKVIIIVGAVLLLRLSV